MWYQGEGVVGMTGWARDVLLSGHLFVCTNSICLCVCVCVCMSAMCVCACVYR